MIQEKTFRINLPTLFDHVNERRQEQGLPSVEPAIMAVRASIKFAIRRQKFMDLKDQLGELEMDESDAGALCQVLGELFNVDLCFDEQVGAESGSVSTGSAERPPAPAGGIDEGATYVLPLFQFYAAINRERRTKGMQPVEPAVISVRTGIKFTIMQKRTLNFRDNELMLSEADLRSLDSIVAQQFDAALPGGLLGLCKSVSAEAQPVQTAAGVEGPKSFLSRILDRFKGRQGGHEAQAGTYHHTHHYSLDTSNLLLSILTRRAYLGHKPLSPDKVKSRCGKALSAELELDMDGQEITLTPEQIDTFAEIIRREFEIMFEDIDDLLGKKQQK